MTFRFLNVGHGSSTIIEFDDGSKKHFGVIDSNADAVTEPRALAVLRALGAAELSFLCLTHPHKDHYSGLYAIARYFDGRIGQFYSCPMGDLVANSVRRQKLAKHLMKIASKTDGMAERQAAVEFLQIIKWASGQENFWTECAGEENTIGPPGFSAVSVHTVLPLKASKGEYIGRIERDDPNMFGHVDDNDISLAIRFSYGGIDVVLGGDGTLINWRNRRTRFERNVGRRIMANVVNLPHHGSHYDSAPEVLENLFAVGGDRYGVTSANGHSHPSQDVIEWLSSQGISPFCTNLMPACGANASKLLALPGINAELAAILRQSAVSGGVIQPCQGDITLTIESNGNFAVVPQHRSFCGYRKTFASLFPMVP
ncbi:hypothetical protein [Mesorhizobium sp. M0589]|uniref:ComEC/Rec2 family competence protein n=1 Tax=Mesorhizobium sp. M0589 TaxID=2956965 RepID=UPI0033384D62